MEQTQLIEYFDKSERIKKETKEGTDYFKGEKINIFKYINKFKNTILHECIHKMEYEVGRAKHQKSGMREWTACSQALLYYDYEPLEYAKQEPFHNVYFFSNTFTDYIVKKYGKEMILKMNRLDEGDLFYRFDKATGETNNVSVLKDFLKSINWQGKEYSIRKLCKGNKSERIKFCAICERLRNFELLQD